jgi:hypothetical protein
VADDLTCENQDYGKLVGCFVCETCAEHCALRDPEAYWEAHEAWRLGEGDPALAEVTASLRPPRGIPPAPRPRKLS